jgi:hypothetical protein
VTRGPTGRQGHSPAAGTLRRSAVAEDAGGSKSRADPLPIMAAAEGEQGVSVATQPAQDVWSDAALLALSRG